MAHPPSLADVSGHDCAVVNHRLAPIHRATHVHGGTNTSISISSVRGRRYTMLLEMPR